jgi:starch synthase
LNGVDYNYWNPCTDPLVPHHYAPDDPANKMRNKAALQELCGFEKNENIPLFGFVGRLAQQKGLDLLAAAMENLSRLNLQIVVQGVGEQKYQDMLRYLSTCYSSKLRLFLKFDEPIAHQIYAGSDFFLMPSQYEPCGLSQMISLRYGTIPIVYRTGGLSDTVQSCSSGGNGFVFEHYNRDSLIWAIQQAMQSFQSRKTFDQLVTKAFTYDFSWDKSAEKYVSVYERLLGR